MRRVISKDGKPSTTHVSVEHTFVDFSLVKLKLETGRTHQNRVHCQMIHYPIAGDPVYGPKKTLPAQGQLLHAYKLSFIHPTTQELMTFEVPLPEEFQQILQGLEER